MKEIDEIHEAAGFRIRVQVGQLQAQITFLTSFSQQGAFLETLPSSNGYSLHDLCSKQQTWLSALRVKLALGLVFLPSVPHAT